MRPRFKSGQPEEELISRIWQHVYGLRAELIAFARLESEDGYREQADDHRQAALIEQASLKEVISTYREIYGDELIKHGDVEFQSAALERLTGWKL